MSTTDQTTKRINFVGSVIATIDSMSLTTIYILFLNPMLTAALEMGGKFFLFPITIIAGIFRSIFACRQAYLDNRPRHIIMAIVEIATTLTVSTAIIGGLAAATVFALATPILFAVCFGLRTLFHLVTGIYYGVQSYMAKDHVLKREYEQLAVSNLTTVVIGTLITTAVICVFLLGKPIVAACGVTAGAIATYLGVIAGYESYQQLRSEAEAASRVAPVITPVKPPLDNSQSKTLCQSPLFQSAPAVSYLHHRPRNQ